MHDTNFVSRIAEKLTLRRLEAISLSTTAVAFALTVLLVTTGRAEELNPVAVGLLDAGGWAFAGLFAITIESLTFEYLDRRSTNHPQVTLLGATAIAFVGVVDLLINIHLWMSVSTDSGSFFADKYTPVLLLIFLAAVLAIRRRKIQPLMPDKIPRTRVMVVFVVLLIVTSPILPVLGAPFSQLSMAGTVSAASADELGFSGDGNGVIKAFYISDGSEAWSTSLTADNTQSIHRITMAPDGSLVYASDSEGDVHALYPSNGTVAWTFGGHTNDVYGLQVSPDNEIVYSVGESIKAFYTDNRTEIWSTALASNARDMDLGTNGEYAYVTDYDANLYKFDTSNGNQAWSVSTGGATGAEVAVGQNDNGNERVYVSALFDTLLSYAPDGSQIWANTSRSNTDTALVLNNGILYFGGSNYGNVGAMYPSSQNTIYNRSVHGDGVEAFSVSDGGTHFYSVSSDQTVKKLKLSDGSTVWSSGIHSAKVYSVSAYRTNTESISGSVSDQTGAPVANATVVGYAATTPTTSDARDTLSKLANPLPPQWTSQDGTNVDIRKTFANADSYVATHTKDALPRTAPWIDSANLRNPKLALPANEDIILSAWDGSASGLGTNTCIPGVGSEYDCQLPGAHKDEATLVVERLGPGGDVTSRSTLTLDQTAGGGFGDPDSFAYTTANLQPGYYLIYEQGSTNKGLVRQVGSPSAILDRYEENVKGALSDRASNIRDKINGGSLQRVTATTDANGNYQLDVPSSAKIVTVQAYYAPGLLSAGYSASSYTQADIREKYNDLLQQNISDLSQAEQRILSTSVYFPTTPRTVEPPASDVDITMYELAAPPGSNVSALQDRLQRLENLLYNGTFSELPGALQQRLEELNRDRLEDLYSELDQLRQRNSELNDRVEEILGEEPGLNEGDASTDELRERIQALQQALTELKDTIESGPGEITKGDGAVSYSQFFDTDLTKEEVVVRAHFTNGTSVVVPDEFITIDERLSGGSVVQIMEYPLPENVGAVAFDIRVATEDGVGGGSSGPIKNPLFDGTLPQISAVEFSSLKPGAGDSVTMRYHPSDDSSFRQLTDVTVYGPSGASVPVSNITNGRAVTFTPDEAGIYHIRSTIEDTEGREYVNVNRLKVGQTGTDRPASLRARESPLGTYALVGDGLSGGGVDIASGGQVSIFAQIAQDGEVPPVMHVYTESLSMGRTSDTTIRVVRGETRESINRHVSLVLHTRALSENALVYRGESNPITRDGETRYGEVLVRANGTTIETYSEADGAVRIRTINEPSFIDRIRHRIRVSTADINVPFVGLTAPKPAVVTAAEVGV